jgi:hypothetical protein
MANKMSKIKQANVKIIIPATLLFGILMLLKHKGISVFGDDLQFSKVTLGFGEWISRRYMEWSSRVMIESVMYFVAKHFLLWKVLDAFMLSVLYYFFVKIFSEKVDAKNCLIGALCLLLYPFSHMGSAGYMATTLNYLWPLAFAFVAGYSMKKSTLGLKTKSWEYPVYIFSLLFASSQEQMCVFLFGMLVLLLLFDFIQRKEKKLNVTLLVYLCLVSGVLLSHLLCPGISIRFEREVQQWWPDYAAVGFFQKVQLAFSSTLSHYVFTRDVVFISFCVMLYFSIRAQYRSIVCRGIGIIPLAVSLFFGIGETRLAGIIDISKWTYYNHAPGMINEDNLKNIYTYEPLILLAIVVVCVLAGMYMCFKDDLNKLLLSVSLLLLGFATRGVMAFSPTLWVSGTRTFIFLYFSLLICTFLFYQKIRTVKDKRESIAICILVIITIYANLNFFV